MGAEKGIWDAVERELTEGIEEMTIPPYVSVEIENDFKHFLISLSRYKFVGKLLEGKESVLEVGCNVGFKTKLLSQFVDYVIGLDFDEEAISYATKNYGNEKRRYICADITTMPPLEKKVDAVISLDVIEHIDSQNERQFINALINNLKTKNGGICVIGTPNITASQYQSEASRKAHINMYSHERLRALMNEYFYNVFMFGMNDEVVHTGYLPMAHYLFAVGVGVKE